MFITFSVHDPFCRLKFRIANVNFDSKMVSFLSQAQLYNVLIICCLPTGILKSNFDQNLSARLTQGNVKLKQKGVNVCGKQGRLGSRQRILKMLFKSRNAIFSFMQFRSVLLFLPNFKIILLRALKK